MTKATPKVIKIIYIVRIFLLIVDMRSNFACCRDGTARQSANNEESKERIKEDTCSVYIKDVCHSPIQWDCESKVHILPY